MTFPMSALIVRLMLAGMVCLLPACRSVPAKHPKNAPVASAVNSPAPANDWLSSSQEKFQNGDVHGSLQILQAAALSITDDYRIYYRMGACYERLEDHAKAVDCYSRALALHPTSVSYERRGYCYITLKNYEKALEDLNHVIELDGKGPNANFYGSRAFALVCLNRLPEAVENASRSISLLPPGDPASVYAYRIRAEAFYKSGQFLAAIKDYDSLIALKPDAHELYFNRALIYYQIGDLDSAISNLRRALAGNPADPRYNCQMGICLGKRGSFDNALIYFTKACDAEPSAINLAARGFCYAAMNGQFRLSALADLNSAIALDKDTPHADWYRMRGRMKLALGRKPEALWDYEKACDLGQNDPDLYDATGWLLTELNRGNEAIAYLDRAILLNPKNLTYYEHKGIAYENAGQLEKALSFFNQVIALDPQRAMSYNNRGFFLLKQGKLNEAIKDFDHCIELDDLNGKAYINRGNAKAMKGDDVGAALDRALGSTRPPNGRLHP